MVKFKLLLLLIFISFIPSAFAGGFYSSPSHRGHIATCHIATSVAIENKGIFNLVVAIEFLKEPLDKAPFTSGDYEEMMKRLNVEWSGVVSKRILTSNNYKVTDLAVLKENIEKDLEVLISESKKKHNVDPNAEVVFSIGSFYLVNLNNE